MKHSHLRTTEAGKVKVKFLWLPSIIISIVGTIVLTLLLNIIF